MLKIYAIFILFTNAKNPVYFIYQNFKVFIQIQYHYFFHHNELYTGQQSFSMSMHFLNNRKFHKLQNARALSTVVYLTTASQIVQKTNAVNCFRWLLDSLSLTHTKLYMILMLFLAICNIVCVLKSAFPYLKCFHFGRHDYAIVHVYVDVFLSSFYDNFHYTRNAKFIVFHSILYRRSLTFKAKYAKYG